VGARTPGTPLAPCKVRARATRAESVPVSPCRLCASVTLALAWPLLATGCPGPPGRGPRSAKHDLPCAHPDRDHDRGRWVRRIPPTISARGGRSSTVGGWFSTGGPRRARLQGDRGGGFPGFPPPGYATPSPREPTPL